MKFRALNYDYHADASYSLWEEQQDEPLLVIRLQPRKKEVEKPKRETVIQQVKDETAAALGFIQTDKDELMPDATSETAVTIGADENGMHTDEAMDVEAVVVKAKDDPSDIQEEALVHMETDGEVQEPDAPLRQEPTAEMLEFIRLAAAAMMKRIRKHASVLRLANEPWSESIRRQSRPRETPKLPLFKSVLDYAQVFPTVAGFRSMESLLRRHSDRLRLCESTVSACANDNASSKFSFSLLDFLQSKGSLGLHPIGKQWARTLKKERAVNSPRDENSRAIVLYQGPATVTNDTPIPPEWVMAYQIAMAALKNNISIPLKVDASSSHLANDPQAGNKRKSESLAEPSDKPHDPDVVTTRRTKPSQATADGSKVSSKVSFAQAVRMHHPPPEQHLEDLWGEAIDLDDCNGFIHPAEPPTSTDGFKSVNDTSAAQFEATRKRERQERVDRKKERKAKRARKRDKKLEKKRKRDDTREQTARKRESSENNGPPIDQPYPATDKRKPPPETLFARDGPGQGVCVQSQHNNASKELIDQELGKARTTLMRKSLEKRRGASTKTTLPRAIGHLALDRVPMRPVPSTAQRGRDVLQAARNAFDQRPLDLSRSISQPSRNGPASSSQGMMPTPSAIQDSNRQMNQAPKQFPQPQQQGPAPWSWTGRKDDGTGPTQPDMLANNYGQYPSVQTEQPRVGLQQNKPAPNDHSFAGGFDRKASQPTKSGRTPLAPAENGSFPDFLESQQREAAASQSYGVPGFDAFQGNSRGVKGFESSAAQAMQQGQVHSAQIDNTSTIEDHHFATATTGHEDGSAFNMLKEKPGITNQEEPRNDFSHLPALKLLCSEGFIEARGNVVAELASGRWAESIHQSDNFEGLQQPARRSTLGRKCELVDTPLVDICGVDLELPNRRAILVYNVSPMEAPQQARETVIRLAQLVATGRYKHIDIILCYDVPVTSSISRHILRMQTAVMGDDNTTTSTFFKIASPTSLAAVIAETALAGDKGRGGHSSALSPETALATEKIPEWSKFLLSLLPSLSVNGAIQCIQLAQHLSPSETSFGLLFQSSHVRQQITMAATSTPCKAPEIHPCAMAQLSHILRVSFGKGPAQLVQTPMESNI